MHFKETQHINPKAIYLAFVLVIGIIVTSMILSGDNYAYPVFIGIAMLGTGICIALRKYLSFSFLIMPDSIEFGISGSKPRKISIASIEAIEIHELHALKQFGGWGLRYVRKEKITGYIFEGSHYLKLKCKHNGRFAFSVKNVQSAVEYLRKYGYPITE